MVANVCHPGRQTGSVNTKTNLAGKIWANERPYLKAKWVKPKTAGHMTAGLHKTHAHIHAHPHIYAHAHTHTFTVMFQTGRNYFFNC